MRKVLRSIALCLMFVIVMMTLTSCKADDATKYLTTSYDEETQVVTIKNESAQDMRKSKKVIVLIGDDEISETLNIEGFSTVNLELKDYFTKEYLEGKEVQVSVTYSSEYCIVTAMSGVVISVALCILCILIYKRYW